MTPTEEELALAIQEATRQAVSQLFAEHKEAFYYLSLITTGEAHAPFLSAWSVEALEVAAANQGVTPSDLKWSYADSPYTFFGEHFFEEVKRLFSLRVPMDHARSDSERDNEFNARLNAMELAVARLDEEGLFGHGLRRSQLVLNVEIMPPDHTNTDRAKRLNPHDALVEWLIEAAEP